MHWANFFDTMLEIQQLNYPCWFFLFFFSCWYFYSTILVAALVPTLGTSLGEHWQGMDYSVGLVLSMPVLQMPLGRRDWLYTWSVAKVFLQPRSAVPGWHLRLEFCVAYFCMLIRKGMSVFNNGIVLLPRRSAEKQLPAVYFGGTEI